jgi:ketosteroid isomerase-like protein
MADSMAVVDRMYECFGRGDMGTLKTDVFAEDIVWVLPGHNTLSGAKHGADEVIAFFGALMKAGVEVKEHTGHGTVNGREYLFPTCSVYTIRDNKIAEVHVYTADQHGVDDFFWNASPLTTIPERLA